jgi:NitT/TauT family transport system permease protein
MENRKRRTADTAWGAFGFALLLGGWAWVHAAYGSFVMPSLAETLAALGRILTHDAGEALAITLLHAAGGAAIAIIIGFILGVLGGLVRPFGSALSPAVTAILGVPPIAWVVLAILWFGPGLFSPLFTVTLATMPIIFISTMHGMRARDANLGEMAQVFRLPRKTRFLQILLPALMVHVAPALSTVSALSWKVALTAELLGDGTGIGGRFATARAFLDLPEAMAWVVLVVVFVLVTDGLLLRSLRRWLGGDNKRKLPEAAFSCPGIRGRSDA